MRSVQADAHGAMQSCVSALRGTARQHLVPKALDGLERLRKRDLKECAQLLVAAAMDIARGLGSNPEFGTLSRLGGRRR